MTEGAILYPVFVQVALTCGLLIWTGKSRIAALKAREVRISQIAFGQGVWPDRVSAISNSYASQFELPVLFYLLVVLALVTGKVSGVLIGLAWVFVVTRIVHVGIYTTSNNVQQRFAAFVVGASTLAIMWALFCFQIIKGAWS